MLPVEDGDGRGKEKSLLSGAGAQMKCGATVNDYFSFGERRGRAARLPQLLKYVIAFMRLLSFFCQRASPDWDETNLFGSVGADGGNSTRPDSKIIFFKICAQIVIIGGKHA